MTRLYRIRAKSGQLLMKYGRDEDGNVGTVFAWGEGCNRADVHLVHNALSAKSCYPNHSPKDYLDHFIWEPAVFEELERRGYDIKTATFSIMKKKKAGA